MPTNENIISKAASLKQSKAEQKEFARRQGLGKVRQQKSDKDTELGTLQEIIKDLGLRNVQNEDTLDTMLLMSKDITTSLGKDLAEKVNDLFDATNTGSRKERKEAKAQSKLLKEVVDKIGNKDDREILTRQINNLDNLIASDKKILTEIGKQAGNIGPAIAGVVATAFSDSPFIGAAALFGTKFIKDKLDDRKKRKLEIEKEAISKKREMQELIFLEKEKETLQLFEKRVDEHAQTSEKAINELQDMWAKASEEYADNTPTAEKDKSSATEDLSKLESEKEKEANDERRHDEMLAQNKESKESVKVEKEGLLSRLKGAIMGGLSKALIGFATFKTFFGGLLKKVGSGISKFLKKIPIIGLFLAGKGIFDELGGLPDDASIMDKIAAGLKGATEGILDFFLGLPIMLIDWLAGTDIKGFIDSQGGLTQTLANAISGLGTIVGDFVSGIVQWFKEKIKNLLSIIPGGEKIFESLFPGEKKLSEQSDKELKDIIKDNTGKATDVGVFDFLGGVIGLDTNAEEALARVAAEQELARRQLAVIRQQNQVKFTSQVISNANNMPVAGGQVNVIAPQTNISNKVESKVFVRPTVHDTRRPPRESVRGLEGSVR